MSSGYSIRNLTTASKAVFGGLSIGALVGSLAGPVGTITGAALVAGISALYASAATYLLSNRDNRRGAEILAEIEVLKQNPNLDAQTREGLTRLEAKLTSVELD